MKLQLLVAQYKESEEVLINLLNSIAMQQGINLNDVEVLIMNDGTDILLSQEFLKQYPFNIEYYLSPHVGVSAIRQSLLEKATADYVMFCDADDMFSNLLALNIIFTYLQSNKLCDIIVPAFYKELPVCQEYRDTNLLFNYQLKGDKSNGNLDGIFIHGKVFRRKFLIDNNIKWNPTLTLNEDSYFNIIALAVSKNTQYCTIPYYIWKFNLNSVTRSDPEWTLHNYITLIDSNIALIQELKARQLVDTANLYVCKLLCNAYFLFSMQRWNTPEHVIYKNKIVSKLKEYLKSYKDYFNSITDELKNELLQSQFSLIKLQDTNLVMKFNSWVNSLA